MRKFMWLAVALALLFLLTPAAYAAGREGREAYYAQVGDTVEKIAFCYDLDAELVAAMNNTKPDSRLNEGRVIWLPLEPISGVTVQQGDTLWSLAKKYNTSVNALCELNNITNSNVLKIGQALQLPGESNQTGQARMVLAKNEPVLASRGGGGGFIWPVKGTISSAYGQRSRGWHCGLDIAAASGSAILSARAGIVTQAGWRSNKYGYAVMLDHGNGLETLYAHNSKVLVKEGQFVRQGQPIAEVGATGNATGAHVHLEVRLNNVCQNPAEYLR